MMGTPQVNVSLVGKFDRKDEVHGTYRSHDSSKVNHNTKRVMDIQVYRK